MKTCKSNRKPIRVGCIDLALKQAAKLRFKVSFETLIDFTIEWQES